MKKCRIYNKPLQLEELKKELYHPPHHPVSVKINAKGVDAGDEDIETEVKLVAMDEEGVGYVALHNYWILLLHLLLFLRVHFDLSRNLRHNVEIRPETTINVRITLLGQSITHAPMPHMLFGSLTM